MATKVLNKRVMTCVSAYDTLTIECEVLAMSKIANFEEVEKRVITIQGKQVIIDRDVADLYGVETKRVNEAIKNNPDKFPEGYIISLELEEWTSLRSKISTLETNGKGQHSKYVPKAFTEKGLYMLATILKSPQATQTTIAIVETFTRIRELSSVITRLHDTHDESEQKSLMQKSGDLLSEILDDNTLEVSGDETTIELNMALVKLKHTIKRSKRTK